MKFFFSFLFLSPIGFNQAENCPPEWEDFDGEFCLKVGLPLESASWFDMLANCNAIDGYIPELTSGSQVELFNEVLMSYESLFGSTLVYLGGSDLTHEGSWRWFNHESTVDPDNWAIGSPDDSPNNTKDCLATNVEGLWRDVECQLNNTTKVANLCMRSASSSSTTTIHPKTTTTNIITTTAAPAKCAKHWHQFESSCYHYEDEPRNWPTANSTCADMHQGAHLATVKSAAENNFVNQLSIKLQTRLSSASWIWLGGYRIYDGNVSGPWNWLWVDGSNWKYANWKSNQPDNDGDNEYNVFSNVFEDGVWGDWQGFEVHLSYMCEYSL